MRKYRTQLVEVSRRVEVEALCDGCGISVQSAPWGTLMRVAIEVNLGEEYGRRDEYDYCDPCLVLRADVLVAAGSKSRLVTGEDPPDEEDGEEG